jgi:hypothetical protein
VTRHEEGMRRTSFANCQKSSTNLTHNFSAADRGAEAGLGGGYKTTRVTYIASDEVETISSLVEEGVAAIASLYCDLRQRYQFQEGIWGFFTLH